MSRHAFRAASALLALSLAAQSRPLLPPFPAPDRITPGEQTAPAQCPGGRILLPVLFTDASERVYWDIPLPKRLGRDVTALEIELACASAECLRGISLHLRSGDGWFAFPTPLHVTAARQRFDLPQGLFQPEGRPGAWHQIRSLRLSAWKRAPGSASLTLFGLAARSDNVALIRATDCTAPGETAFASAMTDRCGRLLAKAGIPFAVTGDALEDLDTYRLLFLPYAPTLPERQLNRLARFVNRGGKLILFYNASQPLGALTGVRPGAWQGAEAGQEWSAFATVPEPLAGLAARIPHFTNSLLPPYPSGEHRGRTVAFWADATGRVTDTPACALTGRCAWFAHVPPLAYPAAVTLTRALVGSLCPELPLPPAPPQPAAPALPPAPANEIRAAWETSGYARHPRGWDGLLAPLAACGVNTVFAHWQSAGTAHYRSDGKRAESDRPRAHRSDPLADALEAGRKHNVAMHAWATCWALEGCAPAQRETLTREDRLMRDAAGNSLPWLCPAIPENRALLIDGFCDLARRGVAGIHLDYVRFPEETGCYAPATRAAFEKQLGRRVDAWPAEVLPGGARHAAFRRFRFGLMTGFVREARAAVRAVNPAVRLSAAVFPTPEGALLRGQDWPEWVREGLLDFVCPMIYSEDATAFGAMLATCVEALPHPSASLVPGIGTGADESQLDAAAASLQIRACRERRVAGFAFFAVDDALLTLLPQLFP
ncbi:MAG: family 10 glycosylhydrolase [Kiritimatiellia bacterium]|jgi:uncharacterized lipoprotein YddW (UPF0748 family)|nr:family 10 glycosylhydrolase [Kiritimatiellia bacterium]